MSRSNQGPRIKPCKVGVGKGMGRIGSSRKREVWRNWGNERVGKNYFKGEKRVEVEEVGEQVESDERQISFSGYRGEGFLLSNGKKTRKRSAIIAENADGLIWFADRSASIRGRTERVDGAVIKGIEWRAE